MRKSECKETIRKVLRQILDKAGDNPPNINQAWDLLKSQMPVSRGRVRQVLDEEEFIPRRPRPGRKPKRPPDSSGTAPDIPPAI
jgi:hypothetical protein